MICLLADLVFRSLRPPRVTACHPEAAKPLPPRPSNEPLAGDAAPSRSPRPEWPPPAVGLGWPEPLEEACLALFAELAWRRARALATRGGHR